MRLDAGDHQPLPGARHRHVQGIDLFALAFALFVGQQFGYVGTGPVFTGQKDKPAGCIGLPWPIQQDAHGFCFGCIGIGVQNQHRMRLETLGTMNRQQSHGVGLHGRRRNFRTCLERAHQLIRGYKTPATHLQGDPQQGLQIGQNGLALAGWRSACKPGQHVAMAVNGLQSIVWRQLLNPPLILLQAAGNALQVGVIDLG